MFETETVGPFLFQKLKWLDEEGGWGWGGNGPPGPPVATTLYNYHEKGFCFHKGIYILFMFCY